MGYATGLAVGQLRSNAGKVGRSLWHFVQMFVSMMIGMPIYYMLTGKPTDANLVLWYAGMELSMVPGMVALMLYQRHGWRHTAEMTGGMLIGPAILTIAAQFGWYNYITGLSLKMLLGLTHLAMLLGMLGAMLYRSKMYTSPHEGHQHAQAVDVHVHHGSA